MNIFGKKPFGKPIQPQRRQQKCEIITEKKGDKVIRKIKGDCTKEQLQALQSVEREERDVN